VATGTFPYPPRERAFPYALLPLRVGALQLGITVAYARLVTVTPGVMVPALVKQRLGKFD
jgi:hypothetical protein